MAHRSYPIEMVNGVPVVTAPAEIDASNADWLRAVLWEAAACGHGTFVVDMTHTRFCASPSLGVLQGAHNQALDEGGELRLVIPASALVLRMFAVSGLDQVIPNFPSLYQAVVPPRAPTPPRPHRRRPRPGMRTPADRQSADPGRKSQPGLRRKRIRRITIAPSPRLAGSRDDRLYSGRIAERRLAHTDDQGGYVVTGRRQQRLADLVGVGDIDLGGT